MCQFAFVSPSPSPTPLQVDTGTMQSDRYASCERCMTSHSYHCHHLCRIRSQSAVLRSPYPSSPLHSASILITEHQSEVNPHPQSASQSQDYLSPSKLVRARSSHLVYSVVHMHTLIPHSGR